MRALLCSVLCVAACEPVPAVDRAEQAIVGGSADAATSSVFLLELRFDNGRNSICTATLISPRVLLTAAHCLDPRHQGAQSVVVRAMNKPNDVGLRTADFTDVTEWQLHPQWDPTVTRSDYDIAVALLAVAPSGVTAQALQRTPPTSPVGRSLRAVGYGRTSASVDDSATRRAAMVTVTRQGAQFFEFGVAASSGICAGDSGGPSFLVGTDGVERVWGVHSSTLSSQCGLGADIRVDTNLSLIDGFISAKDGPQCGGDGRCRMGCTPVDVDCVCLANGVCDASCEIVANDPDCPAACADDGVCQLTGCGRPDADCERACAANGMCNDAVCGLVDPDCGVDGVSCQAAGECQGGQCLDGTDGMRFCSSACEADAQCTQDLVCLTGFCRPPVSKPEPKPGCATTDALAAWPLISLWWVRRRALEAARARAAQSSAAWP